MKRKKTFIDFVDDGLDLLKYHVKDRADVAGELLSDAGWWVVQWAAWLWGIFTIKFVSLLFINRERPSRIWDPARKVVVLAAFPFVWFLFQIWIGAVGLCAAILGLRKGKEYGFFENLLVWIPVLTGFVFLPCFVKSTFALNQLTQAFSYSIVILGLNILIGVAGQSSLGQAAFCLIGGYTTALLTKGAFFGVSCWSLPAVLLGGLVAALVGLPLGLPAVRIKGPYLALITLGLMVSVGPVIKSKYLRDITGGVEGIMINSPEPPAFLGMISQSAWMYYLAFVCVCALIVTAHLLLHRTKVGRAFLAIRDSEEKCSVLGINVPFYKMVAFGVSAFYAGVGGGLLALNTGFIGGDSYTVNNSLDYLVAAAIGGLGSILGSVVGGVFLALQSEITQALSKFVQHGAQLLWTLYGVLVIVVMLVAPKGIVGEIQQRLFGSLFVLPRRRHHRRNFFPDYEVDEELMTGNLYQAQALHPEGESIVPLTPSTSIQSATYNAPE